MTLFIALVENLPQIIIAIVAAIPQIMIAVIDGFLSYLSELGNVGWKLITGFIDEFTSVDWGEVGMNIIRGSAKGSAMLLVVYGKLQRRT